MLLRTICYRDSEQDFTWNDPFQLAQEVGIIKNKPDNEICYRGDMVEYCWNLLGCSLKNSTATLLDQMIEQKVFSERTYKSVYNKYFAPALIIIPDDPVSPQNPEITEPPKAPDTSDSSESIVITPPSNGNIGDSEYGEDW